MTRAYYNENDPKTAAWLKELIRAGLIAPGDVDERSIKDVQGSDVAGYTQCHFFAGIGGWSYALRLAGWRDDEPIWTGSCPCPPFSACGKKKRCPGCGAKNLLPHPYRTGIFVCCICEHEWLADDRHLWPEFRRIIEERKPAKIVGEQVAGKDGLIWLAGVRATLEELGYSVGAADLCAAGIGAPHIRQRIYWLADAAGSRRDGAIDNAEGKARDEARVFVPCADCDAGRLVYAGGATSERDAGSVLETQAGVGARGSSMGIVISDLAMQAKFAGWATPSTRDWKDSPGMATTGVNPDGSTRSRMDQLPRQAQLAVYPTPRALSFDKSHQPGMNAAMHQTIKYFVQTENPGALNPAHSRWLMGFPPAWDALRGYGNAIVPQVAAQFIQASEEALVDIAAKEVAHV